MKKLCLVLVVSCIGYGLYAQEIVSASGDYFQGEGASISFTIGEPVTETFSSSEKTLTQGFQQYFAPISGIGEDKTELPEYRIFPNPVTDQLNLSGIAQKVDLSVYDASGNQLFKAREVVCPVKIETSGLSSGLYLLKISSEGKEQLTLKFQKL